MSGDYEALYAKIGGGWGRYGPIWPTWKQSEPTITHGRGASPENLSADAALLGYESSRLGTLLIVRPYAAPKDPYDLRNYAFAIAQRGNPDVINLLHQLGFSDAEINSTPNSGSFMATQLYMNTEKRLEQILTQNGGTGIAKQLATTSKFGWDSSQVTGQPLSVKSFGDAWDWHNYERWIGFLADGGATEPSIALDLRARWYSIDFISNAMNRFFSTPAAEFVFDQGWGPDHPRAWTDTLDPKKYGTHAATTVPYAWVNDTEPDWHYGPDGSVSRGLRNIFEIDPETFQVGSIQGPAGQATSPTGEVSTFSFGQRRFRLIIAQPVLDQFTDVELYGRDGFFYTWNQEFYRAALALHPQPLDPNTDLKQFAIDVIGQAGYDIRVRVLQAHAKYAKDNNLDPYPVTIPDWSERPPWHIVRPFPSPFVGYSDGDKFNARLLGWIFAYAPFYTQGEFDYFSSVVKTRLQSSPTFASQADTLYQRLLSNRAANKSEFYTP